MMEISQNGLRLIESFEGFSETAYWDSFGRVWTVGYGETEGVGPNTTMTREQAEADLRRRLNAEYEPAIRALGVPLNQNQYDALCSFVWNLGPGSMQWDVGRDLRLKDYEAAANAMLAYDKAGGVQLAGLTRRRQEERALFLKPVPRPKPKPVPKWERYDLLVTDVTLDGKHYNEQAACKTYDELRKHPIRNRRKLRAQRAELKRLADRVAHLVLRTPKRHGKLRWDEFHRGYRYQALVLRAEGKRLVK